MERIVDIRKENFTEVHTRAENVVLDGKPVLRVVKHEKIYEFDENTYAKVKDLEFHNGIIEVKMLSRLLPDAPDFARGFREWGCFGAPIFLQIYRLFYMKIVLPARIFLFLYKGMKDWVGFRRLRHCGNVYNFPFYGAVGNTVCRMWESCFLLFHML